MSRSDADLTDGPQLVSSSRNRRMSAGGFETHAELLSESAQIRARRLVALARQVADEPVRTRWPSGQSSEECHQLHLRGRLDLDEVFTEIDASELWEGLTQKSYALLAVQVFQAAT